MTHAPKVCTHHVFPPIPDRQFDWCAYFDGEEEGLQGWGPTEAEALEDLKRVCQEAQEYQEDMAEKAREHERELAERRGY
jgi:hypothetical protein